MANDIIIVPGTTICSPFSVEWYLGLCPGSPTRPYSPPTPPGPPVPGPPRPPPSAPPPTVPPAEPEPVPEEPAPDDEDDTPEIDVRASRPGDVAFGSFATSLSPFSAQPAPTPRRRRAPRRRRTPKPAPRRRPGTRPGPRTRPSPVQTPGGNRLLAFARGLASRLLGGVVGVLIPGNLGSDPPGRSPGDPLFGGLYGDPHDDPTLDLPGARGLLDDSDLVEVTARPIRPNPYVPQPLPKVEFPLVALPIDPTGSPKRNPKPAPRPKPGVERKPSTNPEPVREPINAPVQKPQPQPEPKPRPQPKPRPTPKPPPRVSPPITLATPSPPNKPGVVTLPFPQPVPREETNKCDCAPKKKKREKKPREVCYRGTFIELSNGLIKHRKEKVPCR